MVELNCVKMDVDQKICESDDDFCIDKVKDETDNEDDVISVQSSDFEGFNESDLQHDYYSCNDKSGNIEISDNTDNSGDNSDDRNTANNGNLTDDNVDVKYGVSLNNDGEDVKYDDNYKSHDNNESEDFKYKQESNDNDDDGTVCDDRDIFAKSYVRNLGIDDNDQNDGDCASYAGINETCDNRADNDETESLDNNDTSHPNDEDENIVEAVRRYLNEDGFNDSNEGSNSLQNNNTDDIVEQTQQSDLHLHQQSNGGSYEDNANSLKPKSIYLRNTGLNEEINEQICIQQHHFNEPQVMENVEHEAVSHVTQSVKKGLGKIKGIHDIERMVENIVTLSGVFSNQAVDVKKAEDMNTTNINELVDFLDSIPQVRRKRKSQMPTQVALTDNYTPPDFTCDVCDKSFSKRSNFMRHRITHAKRSLWKCTLCPKSFTSLARYNQHKPKHLPKSVQKLREVTKNNIDSLTADLVKTEDLSGESGPVFPTLTTASSSDLQVEKKRGENLYTCNICSKIFRYAMLLRFHMDAVHNANPTEEYNCEDCGVKYRGKVSLSRHKRHRPNSQLKCDVCGYLAFTVCEHRQHLITHTDDPLKPYMCRECNKTFPRHICLTTHKYVHTTHKPFACDVCSRTFKTVHHLKNHRQFHQNPSVINVPTALTNNLSQESSESLPTFVCTICNRTYYTRSGLRRHKKQLHDMKCTICDEQYPDVESLKAHVKTHEKKKREATFPCLICGKLFQGNNDLRKHTRIHSGEKPFACELCEKTFRQSVHLREHRRKHTGERPYLCQICNKTFQFSSSLRKHERTQHGPMGLLLKQGPPKRVKTMPKISMSAPLTDVDVIDSGDMCFTVTKNEPDSDPENTSGYPEITDNVSHSRNRRRKGPVYAAVSDDLSSNNINNDESIVEIKKEVDGPLIENHVPRPNSRSNNRVKRKIYDNIETDIKPSVETNDGLSNDDGIKDEGDVNVEDNYIRKSTQMSIFSPLKMRFKLSKSKVEVVN